MARRPLPPAFLLAAALAGCASDVELQGAAAARSRGADVPKDAPAAAGEAGDAAAPARPYDPWLDDTRRLATVNGRVITLAQVRHDMGPAYEQYLDRRDVLAGFVAKKVRDLVQRRIVIDEGKRIGLSVIDEDMDRDEEKEARKAAAAGTTIEQNLRDFGMTRREWDEARRERMLYQRSQAYIMGLFPDFAYDVDRYRPSVDAYVSPSEIRRWGKRHRAVLDSPKTVSLRILFLVAEDFSPAGGTVDDAWRLCGEALDAVEKRLEAGEPFAAVTALGRRFPGAGEGGLYPPVTSASGDLRSQYREWAFAPERKAGDRSGRMKVPAGFVVLFVEGIAEARSPDIEDWGPVAHAEIEGRRRALAWVEVQIALLEESAVSPPDLKASILREQREEARRLRRELAPPEDD